MTGHSPWTRSACGINARPPGDDEWEYTHTDNDPCLGRDHRLQLVYIDFSLLFSLVDILGLVQRGWLAGARLCGVVHGVQQEECSETRGVGERLTWGWGGQAGRSDSYRGHKVF
jgi:hypothetical protein